MKRLVYAAFIAGITLSAIFFEAKIAAQVTASPYQFSQLSPLGGRANRRLHLQSGAPLVQVTNAGDSHSAAVPLLYGSSFNANSTQFIIDVDGQPTRYSFDQIGLGFQRAGHIFDLFQGQANSWQWSATDPDLLYILVGSQTSNQVYSYNTQAGTYTLLKDFSDILRAGKTAAITKSWMDDNSFAFSWRESESAPWEYVVVWDRALNKTYLFTINDVTKGVSGFREAHLDKAGKSLLISGETSLLWRFPVEPQSSAMETINELANPSLFDIEVALSDRLTSLSFNLLELAHGQGDVLSNIRGNTSRDKRFLLFEADSTHSRKDIFIAALVSEAVETENVGWTNLVNCEVINETLVKTGGFDTTDDASADSSQLLSSEDGYIEFTAVEVNKERWCGLRNIDSTYQSSASIEYSVKLAPNRVLQICERGKKRLKSKFRSGDVFRIAVEKGIVRYYQNGGLLYVSNTVPGDNLIASASLIGSNSTIDKALLYRIRSIVVRPGKADLSVGASLQFTATVFGEENLPIWTTTGGTISNTGLYTAPTTPGTYQVTATSPSNPANKGTATVYVSSAIDTAHPLISSVAATNVTASGATVSWITNEASDTQVEYGTTTAYGSSTTLNSTMVTSHSASLSGLAANTLYNYRVKSRDAAGNLATSANFTFTTPAAADTTAPLISAVAATNVTASGATVSWVTNEASNTQVEYGMTTAYGSSTTLNVSMVTSHSATLSGLAAGTLYHYRVKSRDAANNLAISADFTFTTSAAADTTAPVISAVAATNVTASGATVSWITNEASDTQVEYGTTTAYGSSTTLNSTMVTSHSASLSGLAANTLYNYRVKSRDAAGNLATSANFTFTTPAAADTTAPLISAVQASSITATGATISWTTNEASNTQVEYGTTTAYGSSTTLNVSMVTSHSATLSGLAAGTLYHYRVKSRDAANNLATSADFTFTTSAASPPPTGTSFYVAPNGSPSGNGSTTNPWDLQTALNQPASVVSGSTIYLRGGTYIGKFVSSLRGTLSNPITVRSYPGEWAKIDGYATTATTSAVATGATGSNVTFTVANGSRFKEGDHITIDEEQLYVRSSINNTIVAIHGLNATLPANHAVAALVILGGNNFTVNGSDTIYRDFEVLNSDPVRTSPVPNSQNAPHERGEGIWHDGARTKLINLIIHDCQEGIFTTPNAVDSEIYGCIIYNNGYVAGGIANGHGLYIQNITGTKRIVDTLSFNNFSVGFKSVSQNGDSINIYHEGIVAFNNGSPPERGSQVRHAGLLTGANNGIVDNITVTNSFFYQPPLTAGGNVKLGYGSDGNRVTFTNNYVMGGGQGVEAVRWANVTATGNTYCIGTAPSWASPYFVQITSLSGGIQSLNNNTYYDVRSNKANGFCKDGNCQNFTNWKTNFGYDTNSSYVASTVSGSQIFVRPNQYDGNRAHIIIYNWVLGSTVSVDLSAVLPVGTSFEIRNVQDYSAPPVINGVYNGGLVSLPMTGLSVASPLGFDYTPTHTGPEFNVFVLIKR